MFGVMASWKILFLGGHMLLLSITSFASSQVNLKEPNVLTQFAGEAFLSVDSFSRRIYSLFGLSDGRRTLRSLMAQKQMAEEDKFMCDTAGFRSETPPESVHRLMPGDVDVIAAMGDSLTAGNGAFASNVPQLLVNNRGISWSIGGDETWRTALTLPNILKEFNPKITGYSVGKGFSYSRSARFNVAVAGSIDDDILYQAKVLVKRMREDPEVDMENHWKLITMIIGSNDICIFACTDKERHSGEMHFIMLRDALDYLQENVPRTLVNLVLTPDLLALLRMRGKGQMCEVMHMIECPCLFGMDMQAKIDEVNATVEDYRKAERELTESGRYETRDDFAVVLQTFTEVATSAGGGKEDGREMPMDMSLFAVDCFHLSQRGNAYAANALWNNMLEPVGEKSMHWGPEFASVKCPTKEAPYIYTRKNSKEMKRNKRKA